MHHLLMDKCKHSASRVRKRYAFDLFKALTVIPNEVKRTKFASVNVSRARDEQLLIFNNDSLDYSNPAIE